MLDCGTYAILPLAVGLFWDSASLRGWALRPTTTPTVLIILDLLWLATRVSLSTTMSAPMLLCWSWAPLLFPARLKPANLVERGLRWVAILTGIIKNSLLSILKVVLILLYKWRTLAIIVILRLLVSVCWRPVMIAINWPSADRDILAVTFSLVPLLLIACQAVLRGLKSLGSASLPRSVSWVRVSSSTCFALRATSTTLRPSMALRCTCSFTACTILLHPRCLLL